MYQKGKGVEPNFSQAVQWFKKSAKQGNPDAQYELGFVYKIGYSVTKNLAKSLNWYEKSAEQGHFNSILQLVIYYQSDGQEFNPKYLKWLYAMANYPLESNDSERIRQTVINAQTNLKELFQKALDKNSPSGFYPLGFFAEHGYGSVDNKPDFERARQYYEKAAALGDADANYNLGLFYEKENREKGVDQDY